MTLGASNDKCHSNHVVNSAIFSFMADPLACNAIVAAAAMNLP
jgi:hypothetical protein